MDNHNTYVLARGHKTDAHLIIQQEIFGDASKQLLLKAGLKPSMHVLEVGCGIGLMSSVIAEQIAPHGKLTATDISLDQLALATTYCQSKNIDSIQFVQNNILVSNSEWMNTFDLIYVRLVLGHLTDPVCALQNMRSYLKVGGVLVVEETSHESGLSSPPCPIIDQLFGLIRQWQALHGQIQQGNYIHDHFKKLGLKNIHVSLNKPPVDSYRKRQVLMRALNEMQDNFLKENLITQAELKQLKHDLEEFCHQDQYTNFIHITQICGIR